MKTLLKKSLKISVLMLAALFFVVGANSAQALWRDAPSSPPANNAAAPINVGDTFQTKIGGLKVQGNFRVGEIIDLNAVEGDVIADSFKGIEFLYTSDSRLKKDVESLSSSRVSDLLKLEGVSYAWKENGEKDFGLIAQEVEKVYPELVKTDKNSGYKSVKYANLIAPLIELTKYQQKRIESLEAKTQSLEARLERLEKEL